MELSKLYQAILASLNVVADESGLLSLVYGNQSFPTTVEGKRLVLPTPEVLRSGIGPQIIAFHPLSENILRGESPVFRKLKQFITSKLTVVISELLEAFTEITSDHSRHPKLTPDQKELLLALPDADEKTYQTLIKIFEAMKEDHKRKLISVYLKRGGKIKLEKYSRTAIVTFPILSEFENDDGTIYGVKCRKKDFIGFAKLFEYLLPNADNSGYSFGSNDSDVPYFDALIRAFLNVANQLNSRIDLFGKHLKNGRELHIDTSWAHPDHLRWSKYRDLIPVLNGNDGTTTAEELAEETAVVQAESRMPMTFDPARAADSSATQYVHTSAHHQVQQPATAPPAADTRKSTGGIPWQDVVNAQSRRLLQHGSTYAQVPPGQPVDPRYNQQPAYAPPGMTYAAPPAPGYDPRYPQPMPMGYVDPNQPLPPGFGSPAGPPQMPVDAYGRPMGIMPQMAPIPMDAYGRPLVNAMNYNGAPQQQYPQGYGYPQGYPQQYPQPMMQPMVDHYGRPMAAVMPPGNPGRIPSFGTPTVAGYGYNPAPQGHRPNMFDNSASVPVHRY
jgi:hypothetical protein